jgi:DNA polymerase-3 subunit beta
MLDALRTFDAETVEINLIESMKPIVLTSMQDLKLSHIILPVGIKEFQLMFTRKLVKVR